MIDFNIKAACSVKKQTLPKCLHFQKQLIETKEVKCTEPSPSVRFPWMKSILTSKETRKYGAVIWPTCCCAEQFEY